MSLMNFLKIFFFVGLATTLGCQSTGSRQPNKVEFEFDSEKVKLLKWAAQNRILFQFPDNTFEDVSVIQVQESCKKLKEPAWSQLVMTALSNIKRNATLQNKIHVIEVKKGEVPAAEITKDLDGVTYLVLSYAISEKKSIITDISQVPCENKTTLYLGEELIDISFQFPSNASITKALKELPNRATPDRWKFNTEFLNHLASKMTVLKYSPELGFEKSANGDFFFVQFLTEQADAIKNSKFTALDYWLAEITQRSHTGSYLKIMALVQDKQLTYGMNSTQKTRGLAFPFLSYKSQDGKYTYTSMTQLNRCLEELSSRYKRGLASIRSDFSTQPDTFLHPGHVCQSEQP